MSVSYGPDVYLKVLVFPELFGTLGTAFILILVGIYHVQKIIRRRLHKKDRELVQLNDIKTNADVDIENFKESTKD